MLVVGSGSSRLILLFRLHASTVLIDDVGQYMLNSLVLALHLGSHC